MNEQPVILSMEKGGIARLTLNRPEVRHALDQNLINTLTSLLAKIHTDKSIRVVILEGTGHCFSAGLDISWIQSMADSGTSDDARRLAYLLLTLKKLRQPTIAAIDGACVGAGVALATCCDILVATDEAYFQLPAIRIGAAPATVGPFIVAAIGAHQTRRYLLTGEKFTPQDALDIRLIHMMCTRSELSSTIEGLVNNLMLGAPGSLAETKDIIYEAEHRQLSKSSIEDAAKRTIRIRKSREAREGLSAFLEKRNPEWVDDD
jgi:methylglutaconyl-CoA hydratase